MIVHDIEVANQLSRIGFYGKQTRKRVAEHREKKKLELSNVTCNVTVTQCNALDIELELDIERDKDIDKKGVCVT